MHVTSHSEAVVASESSSTGFAAHDIDERIIAANSPVVFAHEQQVRANAENDGDDDNDSQVMFAASSTATPTAAAVGVSRQDIDFRSRSPSLDTVLKANSVGSRRSSSERGRSRGVSRASSKSVSPHLRSHSPSPSPRKKTLKSLHERRHRHTDRSSPYGGRRHRDEQASPQQHSPRGAVTSRSWHASVDDDVGGFAHKSSSQRTCVSPLWRSPYEESPPKQRSRERSPVWPSPQRGSPTPEKSPQRPSSPREHSPELLQRSPPSQEMASCQDAVQGEKSPLRSRSPLPRRSSQAEWDYDRSISPEVAASTCNSPWTGLARDTDSPEHFTSISPERRSQHDMSVSPNLSVSEPNQRPNSPERRSEPSQRQISPERVSEINRRPIPPDLILRHNQRSVSPERSPQLAQKSISPERGSYHSRTSCNSPGERSHPSRSISPVRRSRQTPPVSPGRSHDTRSISPRQRPHHTRSISPRQRPHHTRSISPGRRSPPIRGLLPHPTSRISRSPPRRRSPPVPLMHLVTHQTSAAAASRPIREPFRPPLSPPRRAASPGRWPRRSSPDHFRRRSPSNDRREDLRDSVVGNDDDDFVEEDDGTTYRQSPDGRRAGQATWRQSPPRPRNDVTSRITERRWRPADDWGGDLRRSPDRLRHAAPPPPERGERRWQAPDEPGGDYIRSPDRYRRIVPSNDHMMEPHHRRSPPPRRSPPRQRYRSPPASEHSGYDSYGTQRDAAAWSTQPSGYRGRGRARGYVRGHARGHPRGYARGYSHDYYNFQVSSLKSALGLS